MGPRNAQASEASFGLYTKDTWKLTVLLNLAFVFTHQDAGIQIHSLYLFNLPFIHLTL